MFKFLKEKLKKAVSKFSKDVEEEAEDIEEEVVEEKTEPTPKPKPAPSPKTKPVRKPEPAPKPKPTPKPIPKPEPEEKKEPTPSTKPVPELSPELIGLKESLDDYSEKDIDSLMNMLGFDADAKSLDLGKKVAEILTKPLVEINSAMDKLDDINAEPKAEKEDEEKKIEEDDKELKPEPDTPKAQDILDEIEEDKIEEPEEIKEAEEEKIEEEAVEELEKAEESLEEEPIPEPEEPKKKGGFFSRLFKKKEEEPEPEDEAEVEEEPEPESEEVPEETIEEKEEAVEEPEPVEEEPEEELKEVKKEPKIEEVPEEPEETVEEPEPEDEPEEDEPEEEDEEPKKKGFFGKLTEGLGLKKLSKSKFEDIFFELEVALLENNVAVEVIEKIKRDLEVRMVDQKLKRSQIEEIVMKTLKKSLDEILSVKTIDVLESIRGREDKKKPFVIAFVGINGSGKTTTIAKMARYFLDNDLKTVLVASDTFRAAAIQQLEEHATKLGVKIIKHDYGSDPAAVAFDGIKYATSKGIDVVLIDTAGRLHSNVNLMDEMKKIMRVADPDLKIFIGESITGNDCIEQAQKFNEVVDLDGIILSKADVDEKGGAAISVSYVTGKPILFIGTGQTYADLQKFDKKTILKNLGL